MGVQGDQAVIMKDANVIKYICNIYVLFVTQFAKRGLLAFPNNQLSLIITPDTFNVSLSYITPSHSAMLEE